jgi:hypothetical protein
VSRECEEHNPDDLDRTAKDIDASTSIAEIKCPTCGIRMTVTLRLSGRTVLPDMHIYPATGSTTISRDMITYFFTDYGQRLEQLKGAGYQVADDKPTIHGISVEEGLGLPPPPPRPPSHLGVVATLLAVATIGVLVAVLATHHNSMPAGSASAQSSPTSPAQTAASPADLSWVSYQDPSGFSIKLPAG